MFVNNIKFIYSYFFPKYMSESLETEIEGNEKLIEKFKSEIPDYLEQSKEIAIGFLREHPHIQELWLYRENYKEMHTKGNIDKKTFDQLYHCGEYVTA